MEKKTFDVSGMTCAACEAAVTRAVSKLDGVEQADVSLLAQDMKVEFDPAKVTPQKIEEAVKQAGYAASLQTPPDAAHKETVADIWAKRSERIRNESEQKKKKLIASLILLAVLMCFSMLPMLGVFTFLMDMEWMMVDATVQMFIATLILFIQKDFFTHGFKTLFHGSPNMDTLVAVGSSVSFIYGFYGLMLMAYGYGVMDHTLIHNGMNALYFESAAMIVTLVSLGKYLEARSKSKTGDALAKLVSLAPKTALVKRGADFVEVPAEDVRAGDLVKIVPGASIPVDGIVKEGTGTLDQSAITGESMPVEKAEGDSVMSASTNLNGSFVMEATKVGSDTTLAQIITLVDEAGNSKAPIARLADKVSGVFVPTVLALSLLTLAGWLIAGKDIGFALNCAISVLVISCPCALGLATPLAIMVATGKAAQYGILVKSASALETLAKVNTVVLDKTGTITQGKPSVVSMTLFNRDFDRERFLSIAAAAESGSEHPLAKAVLEEASKEKLVLPAVSSFKAFGGKGLEATVDGIHVQAGNAVFMEQEGIVLSENARKAAQDVADLGGTPLFFAFDGRLCGLIGAADEVRATSRAAIARLRKEGVDVIMLTGDNARTAKAIAANLDVSDVISDVLPADKESVIRKLQDEGKLTVMVGDGINDAPALTRADVGIAVKSGTDIAMESADIVLMKNNLMDVVTAIELSRSTIRNIKENLFWAFFYNCLGIPLAMGLFYPFNGWLLNPMIGAAAMSFSSVTVCLNALRLRFFKPAKADVQAEKADENAVGEKTVKCTEMFEDPAKTSVSPTDGMVRIPVFGPVNSTCKKKASNEAIEKAETAAPVSKPDAGNTPAFAQTTLFHVNGMMCAHCQAHVTQALEALEGVKEVIVSLENNDARVCSDRPIDLQVFKNAIEDAGYEVKADTPSVIAKAKSSAALSQQHVDEMLFALRDQYDGMNWMIWNNADRMLACKGENIPSQTELEAYLEESIASDDVNAEKGGAPMTLKIDGMSCMHCAARVEKALLGVDGVKTAKVDLDNASATVTGDNLDAAALAKAVTAAGYSVSAID